jgi:hypothetical protein
MRCQSRQTVSKVVIREDMANGNRRSEVGGQKSEVRSRRSEVGGQKSEVGGSRYEVLGMNMVISVLGIRSSKELCACPPKRSAGGS